MKQFLYDIRDYFYLSLAVEEPSSFIGVKNLRKLHQIAQIRLIRETSEKRVDAL